jgi:hypothetical protein
LLLLLYLRSGGVANHDRERSGGVKPRSDTKERSRETTRESEAEERQGGAKQTSDAKKRPEEATRRSDARGSGAHEVWRSQRIGDAEAAEAAEAAKAADCLEATADPGVAERGD